MSSGGSDLAAVAAAARRALACDSVVVTRRRDAGSTVLAADGIAVTALRAALPALHAAADGASARMTDVYGWHASAPLVLDGVCVGALHALGDAAPEAFDRPLLEAFAAHSAVVLGHRRLSRRAAALTEQVHRTEAFDRVSLPADSFDELVGRIDGALAAVLGPVRTGLMVCDGGEGVLQLVGGSFGAPESVTASYRVPVDDLHSNAARVFALRRAYVTNTADHDPAILQDYATAFGIERLLSVPLRVADHAVGVLHVADASRSFTMDDVGSCEELAPRIAAAAEQLRLALRLRRQQRIDRVLSDAAVAIAGGARPGTVLSQAVEGMRAVLTASAVAIVGHDEPPVLARSRIAPDAERRLLDDALAERRLRTAVVAPGCAGDPGSALLHVPVQLGTRHVGTVSVRRERAEGFAADERRGVERLATVAALAWAADRFHEQEGELTRLEERQRIADDLHDDVAQILFAAQMQLDAVLERDDVSPEVAGHAERARAHLLRGDAAVRNLISDLSPAELSVEDRLADVVDEMQEQFGLPVQLDVCAEAGHALREAGDELGGALLKVAREALVNAAKHAGPCRATLTLDAPEPGRLSLRIEDDGVGLAEARARRHGIAAMRRNVRRHGGKLRVARGPGGGTTVAVDVGIGATL